MRLEYTNKHKNSASWKTLLMIVVIVATLALLTFIGASIDYWLKTSIMTFIMFGIAFFIAYTLYKRCVVEYKYIYDKDIFTVDRIVGDTEKTIFACDKKYIEDVLLYDEYMCRYKGIKHHHLAFNNKKECVAIVYSGGDKKKAILIHVDVAFLNGLLEEFVK